MCNTLLLCARHYIFFIALLAPLSSNVAQALSVSEPSSKSDTSLLQQVHGQAEGVTLKGLGKMLRLDGKQNSTGTVVVFYSPHCPYSKAVVPSFVGLAANFPSVRFLFADGVNERQMTTRYNVQGFPTIIFFRHGKERARTRGPHTHAHLRSFLESNSGVQAVDVESADVSDVVKIFQEQEHEFDWWLLLAWTANLLCGAYYILQCVRQQRDLHEHEE